jgi:hypothetical protein
MYPEFQYRRPPPSYNASLQDSLHQLAMAQNAMDIEDEDLPAEDYSLPSSNPPSYRSRASTVRTGKYIKNTLGTNIIQFKNNQHGFQRCW